MRHSAVLCDNGSMQFRDFFSKTKLKNWFTENAETKEAKWVLAVIAFCESIFFPIPPDFFLMAILASNRARRWAYYSGITLLASILGGTVSFLIGLFLFDTVGQKIIDFYHLQASFSHIQELFRGHAFFTLVLSSFTPLPDKVFNLAAGLFKINFIIFLVAHTLGRALRFFGVGLAMKLFGARVARVVYKNLNLVSLILVLILVGVFFLIAKI